MSGDNWNLFVDDWPQGCRPLFFLMLFHSIFKLPPGLVRWASKSRAFSSLHCKEIVVWEECL